MPSTYEGKYAGTRLSTLLGNAPVNTEERAVHISLLWVDLRVPSLGTVKLEKLAIRLEGGWNRARLDVERFTQPSI